MASNVHEFEANCLTLKCSYFSWCWQHRRNIYKSVEWKMIKIIDDYIAYTAKRNWYTLWHGGVRKRLLPHMFILYVPFQPSRSPKNIAGWYARIFFSLSLSLHRFNFHFIFILLVNIFQCSFRQLWCSRTIYLLFIYLQKRMKIKKSKQIPIGLDFRRFGG